MSKYPAPEKWMRKCHHCNFSYAWYYGKYCPHCNGLNGGGYK